MSEQQRARRLQQGAALINFLVLVLCVAVAAGGWFGWQQLSRQQATNQDLTDQLRLMRDERKQADDAATAERQALEKRLEGAEVELAARAETLANLKSGGQRNWLLNEAEALASLAQERLLLTADVAAAQRLLEASDKTLARLNDARVLTARKAIAADLEKLRGAQQVDVEAIILQLGALQPLVAKLTLPVSAHSDAAPEKNPAPDQAGWWDNFLYSLPVTIRRQHSAVPLPLEDNQASTLRLYLDNALQQAQLSLLQGKTDSYREALKQARQAISTWLDPENAQVRHLQASLQQLAGAEVDQALPEIGQGLAAIHGLQAESGK